MNDKHNTCLMVINSHLHLIAKYFDEVIIMDQGQIKQHCTVEELFHDHKNNDIYKKYSYLLPDSHQINERQNDQNPRHNAIV